MILSLALLCLQDTIFFFRKKSALINWNTKWYKPTLLAQVLSVFLILWWSNDDNCYLLKKAIFKNKFRIFTHKKGVNVQRLYESMNKEILTHINPAFHAIDSLILTMLLGHVLKTIQIQHSTFHWFIQWRSWQPTTMSKTHWLRQDMSKIIHSEILPDLLNGLRWRRFKACYDKLMARIAKWFWIM